MMKRRVWGFLLGVISFFMTSAIETTEPLAEVADVLWEPIPQEEQAIAQEQGEMYYHTRDVKINEFTYAEAQDLLRVAQAEAGNQGEDGMWLVMSVVFNRRISDTFPNTIHGVIYEPHQFSTVLNGSIDRVDISPEAHLALARIERGEVAPQIIGFETLKSTELDQYFCEVFTHKDHKFYVERSDLQ